MNKSDNCIFYTSLANLNWENSGQLQVQQLISHISMQSFHMINPRTTRKIQEAKLLLG